MAKHYQKGNDLASHITVSRIYRKGNGACNSGMDVHEIRRINLIMLVEKHGGPTKFGDVVGRSQSHISQLMNQKNMGGAIARDIELHLHLEHGWFDILHIAEESATYVIDESAHQADAITADDLVLLKKISGKASATGTSIDVVIAAIDIICDMSPDDRPSYQAIGCALVKSKNTARSAKPKSK